MGYITTPRMSPKKILVGLVVVSSLAAACSSSSKEETILVSAAASLGSAFTQIAENFEAENEHVTVELNFGGSSALLEQIVGGAPVDVFASANNASMEGVLEVSDDGVVSQIFALNSLTIAVPKGNPAGITGLEDFANPDLFLGLCAVPVPCGVYAAEIFGNAGVTPDIDTEESDVSALVLKIELSELDGGIVYRSDVASRADQIDEVPIPDVYNVVAEYPIAKLNLNSDGATKFLEYVLSDAGRQVLIAHGFLVP